MAYVEFDGALDDDKSSKFVEFTGELDAPASESDPRPDYTRQEKNPDGGVGKLLSDSLSAGLDGVEDMAPEPISRLVKAIRGKPIRSRNGSVLETEPPLSDAELYDANELTRLSNRDYAERNDPANPRNKAPSMRAATSPLIKPSQDGIIGRAGDLIAAQGGSATAGALRGAADVASAFGDNPVSETLRQAGVGAKQIADERSLGVSMRADQEGFVGEYAPQVIAQLPQIGLALLSGGIALPAVISGLGSYADARERGLDPVEATKFAVSMGGMEAIGEKLGGMGRMADAFESALKSGFGKKAAAELAQATMFAGIKEIPSELVTYTGQFGFESGYGLNPNPTLDHFTEGAKDTAIVAGLTGGGMGVAGKAAQVAARPKTREEEVARALADELSGRDFDPATAGQAADMIFGTRSVDGSGVNRTGAALVEAERAKLNAMRNQAAAELGAAADVDQAVAAAEKMVSIPTTGPVEEFVFTPTPTLQTPVPRPDSDTLLDFVTQQVQNAPTEGTADVAPVAPADTPAAPAVRATDTGVGSALPQPAGVSVAAPAVQQQQPDTSGAVEEPSFSADQRLVPVSQRAPASVNFAPTLRVLSEDNGRSTVQLVQTPERAQDDQQAIEQLRVAVNRYNPGDGDRIQSFRDLNLPSADRARLDNILGQFERIAFVAERALGVRLRYTRSLNGYGVSYKGNVFIDLPTVLKGDGKNQATGIFLFTAGHEGFHHFETSKNPADKQVAANFKAVLRAYIKDGAVDSRQQAESSANIKAGGKAVTRAYAESEVMADINGAMFIDPAFWRRLYEIDSGSTFRKVLYRMMQSLTKMISAAKKSRLDVTDLVKDVDAVREAAAQAWAQRAQNQTPPDEIADDVVQYRRDTDQADTRPAGIIAEVAPNPDQEVAADWNEMTPQEREQATRAVANKTVQRVADMLGLRGFSFKLSSGKYESDVNPNILIDAPQGATVEQLNEFARTLGYVLDQKAMVAFDEGNTTSESQAGFVKVVLPRQMSTAEIDSLRKFIAEKVPQADGDTLRDGALVFGNFSEYNDKVETLNDEQYGDAIAAAVEEFGWAGEEIRVSEPQRYHSELIWPDNRDGYLKGTRYGESGEVQAGSGGDNVRGSTGRDLAQLREVAAQAIELRDRWIGQRAAARGRSAGDSQAANGAREVGSPEREYGTARDGSVSAVGVHFSQERRSLITSTSFGKGLKGLERERLTDPANSDIKPRINFYVSNGRGVIPEAGVGGVTHTVKLNNLYPVKSDPLKLVKNMKGANSAERASFFERSVMQAGFDGYLDNNTGGSQDFAVLIGKHSIEMPKYSRDFVESPDDINDLGAFNIDTFDFDNKTDEVLDGDALGDIANELTDMGYGVSGAVASKPTDFKAVKDSALKNTLTPEAMFPMPSFAENEYGNLTAPVYAGGEQARLELQPYGIKDEDVWTAFIGALRIDANWGTPLSLRGVTRKEGEGYLLRMAAAKELNHRKFDFYKAIPAKAATRISEFWSMVPSIPGATEFTAGVPEVDGNSVSKLRQIAQARLMGKDYSVQVNGTSDFFFLYFTDKKTGETSEASIQVIGKPRDVGQQSVVFHAVALNKGSGVGKMFYNIANTWANVVGVKVLADPDGLTAVNSVRRTENALSAAARTGGEALIEPGWAQRVYGFDGKAKTPDAKRKNLTRIALAQARNVYELAPDFEGVRYDMDTETFVNDDGSSAEAKVKGIMSRPEVRRFSLGRTSFIRAALTRELMDNEVQLPEEMGSPIMYSRAQLDGYMDGRNKTMPTISGAAAQEADIGLAVKAINAASTEILSGNRDSLPIPIGRTPHAMNLVGAPQKMLHIDARILKKVLFDKHSEDFADVDAETFVRSIYQPAMILKGRGVREMEIVTSIVTKRGPIMVPVTDAGNSYAIMSAYAKNVGGKGESLVKRIKDGALLYADPAMAQVAVTGRESAPIRGINTRGAQFPDAPPRLAQDSNVSQSGISVKPMNPYYIGWDKVRDDIIGGISSRKVKSDVDLMRRIGNLFKGDWEDAPSFSRAQPRQGQNFALPGETWLSQQRRLFQDYFLPVLEVQNAITRQGGSITEQSDVYRAEERMYGRVEETLRDFRQKWFDPLIKEAQENDITMDELSLYAYAKHAKERNAYIQSLRRDMPDTGSGMTNDEADDILTMFEVNGQAAIMEKLHAQLMAITAATRREMLETELITQDEFDAMETQYENYVPLRGFEEVDQNGERTTVARGGRGFNIRGKETTRALGRRTRAGNIIENIVLDYERAVFRGERNMVGQTFLELIRNNPDPALWEIDAERTRTSFNRQTGRVNKSREVDSGPNTVAIKVMGREVYVKIYDERLLRAMRKASKDDTGAIEQFLNSTVGQFTGILRATLTQYNPVFAAVNAVRDVQSGGAAVLDELGVKGVALYAKHYRAALAASGRHQLGKLDPNSTGGFFGDAVMDRYFEEYRAAGGTTGGYYGKSAEDVQQEIRNILLAAGASPQTLMEKAKTLGGTKGGRMLMRGVQSTGKVLEFLGATSENAARVAAYRAAREMGKTPAQAASIAKNLTTNFNRKGEWGQALNAAFLFFNAAVQGSHRTLKALRNPKVMGLAAGMTATGIASAMLAVAVGGEDEDDGQLYWDKIPAFEKERNFIIMLPPGADVVGSEVVGKRGRYIKIPMPYGFNIFPALGVNLVDVIRNSKDDTQGISVGQGATNMLNAIMGSFNPFGGAISLKEGERESSILQAVSPTIGDIIVQQALGVDSFSRPTSPFKSDYDTDPDSENVNVKQAGSVWHAIARGLNSATGGNLAEPGAIDVSPGALQNLSKNLTGGTGTFLADVFLNLPTKMVEPEAEITVRDIPLARNFFGVVDGMNDQSLLYERRREILKTASIVKNRDELDIETTDPTELALVSLAKLSTKYTKAMSAFRKEEIEIADNDEMTTAEKNIRRREIKLERNALVSDFNAAYMDAMRNKE